VPLPGFTLSTSSVRSSVQPNQVKMIRNEANRGRDDSSPAGLNRTPGGRADTALAARSEGGARDPNRESSKTTSLGAFSKAPIAIYSHLPETSHSRKG
jgi:hypothetical protein